MIAEGRAIIRPRTTGEVLDDAWRLALADAPLLLALSALFSVPAAAALVVLLTRPRSESVLIQIAIPCLTAFLLPLTGLGSGACQEVFRRRAEGLPVGPGVCLWAALRQGLEHVAARALVLVGALIGVLMLGLPVLAVWIAGATVHPTLAGGRGRFFEALGEVFSGLPRQSGKATAVTLLRLPLLAFAALNLYFLVQIVLGLLDALTPLDVALTFTQLELDNPVFLFGLTGLAWMLLAPYAEACNHLLYLDARARSEGLDLWFRVGRAFRTGAAVVLATLLIGSTVTAAPTKLEQVRAARLEVERIRAEVEKIDPYPGGRAWVPRLERTARSLDPAGTATRGPYRWFYAGIEGFADRNKDGAGQVLADLQRGLAAAEDSLTPPADEEPLPGGRRYSPDEIKKMLPQRAEEELAPRKPQPEEEPKRERVRREDDAAEEGVGPRRGGGLIGPQVGFGFGPIAWFLLFGLMFAVVVLGVVLYLVNRPAKKPRAEAETGERSPLQDRRPAELHGAQELWREAEEFARQGRFLEAVRSTYLAALAALHRAGLIRYEPMRTNGEYAGMLRARGADAEEVQQPFHELTGLFEQKWYGERGAAGEDYAESVRLAEKLRSNV